MRQGAWYLAYCYTTVQTEKKEVFDLAERFDGNLELAISQLAEKNDDR